MLCETKAQELIWENQGGNENAQHFVFEIHVHGKCLYFTIKIQNICKVPKIQQIKVLKANERESSQSKGKSGIEQLHISHIKQGGFQTDLKSIKIYYKEPNITFKSYTAIETDWVIFK